MSGDCIKIMCGSIPVESEHDYESREYDGALILRCRNCGDICVPNKKV